MSTLETLQYLVEHTRLGREEVAQRLLTSLILGDRYPANDRRTTPSPAGVDFLRRLHGRALGRPWPGKDMYFVDELRLGPRHPGEDACWPDQAVIWPTHIWLIELKAEAGSHSYGQVADQIERARHHHPGSTVEHLYLTGPGSKSDDLEPSAEFRVAHLFWDDVVGLIEDVWGFDTATDAGRTADGLRALISDLGHPVAGWRDRVLPGWTDRSPRRRRVDGTQLPSPESLPRDQVPPLATAAASATLDDAIQIAEQVAADHHMRAVPIGSGNPAAVASFVDQLRGQLSLRDPGDPVRHVVVWPWRPETGGRARTAEGAAGGHEVRCSWYATDQYG